MIDMTLQPLRTDAEYRAALARAEALFDLPEEPDPKAAPMSAPLPCCSSTRTITPIALST